MLEPQKQPRWTGAQQRAIDVRGQSVLVSAAAGSGKTSVLAERCVRLVQPTDGAAACNIDELLVVTFTEAAAGEMRSRIGDALAKNLEQQLQSGGSLATSAATHMQQQLARMARAQISTLHGFCSRLIRQNFHLLGIDPQFTVLEPDMAALLLEETAQELFEERYLKDRFRNLITQYGNGFDQAVLDAAIRIYHTLSSVVDPAAWRAQALRRIAEAGEKPITESQFGREFLQQLAATVAEAEATALHAADVATRISDEPGHAEFARELAQRAAAVRTALASGNLAAARQVFEGDTLRQPGIKKTSAYRDELVAVFEPAKKLLCGSKAKVRRLLAFDAASLQAGMQRTLPAAEELLDLVGVLEERFTAAKSENNALDFSDLERHALSLLRRPGVSPLQPSEVALDCHRRYRHVLVDEYQDINELQSEILRLASRECLDDGAHNLFCVGDVKQSIYRFRLADPTLFIRRQDDFAAGRGGAAINLSENFRSRGPLLEAINAVFRRLMLSPRTEIVYDVAQELKPAATYPPSAAAFSGSPLELHVITEDAEDDTDGASPDAAGEAENLDRAEREARYAAKLIRRLMGQDGQPRRQVYDRKRDCYRDIELGDIVILLRTMAGTANVYLRQLIELGVPAYAESRAGFFDAVEISDMLSLLAVIDNPRQDIPLAAVLRSPVAHLAAPEDCLAAIRLHADAQQGRSIAFHEAAFAFAQAPSRWSGQLAALFASLASWRELAKQRPVDELLWTIYRDTGYLIFCAAQPRGRQRVANLYELHRRARDFSTCERQGLFRFLQMLANAQQRGRVGEATDARVGADTVQIMSVHASKGLEFPVVICPDLGRRFNLSDCRGSILLDRAAGLGLEVVDMDRRVRYESLAGKVISARLRDASMAEELRVLYVAMTRAREHLILLGSASQRTLDGWSSRGKSKPLTDEAVLCAASALQWLYTLAHAPGAASTLALIPIGMSGIPLAPSHRSPSADSSLSTLGAHELFPQVEPSAAAAIVRLSYQYPHQALAHVPAAHSVTALSKQESDDQPTILGADDDIILDAQASSSSETDLLPPPAFMLSTAGAATPADRGTATHLVLQHLDFSPAAPGLSQQIAAMVQQKHLTSLQASLVDQGAIDWWLQSPEGALVRQHHDKLLRELPFYLALPPSPAMLAQAGADPSILTASLDNLMVRGRMDAVLPLPDGIVIIDYKTDRRVPDPSHPRYAGYQRQCEFYRHAVEKLQQGRVSAVYLVFLAARRIIAVKSS